ncbi:XRE family transcriptional regulator [Avibacterium paragallinarum]|nr:XRE family transcriptional regulator [Avibacterium paragallinarum]
MFKRLRRAKTQAKNSVVILCTGLTQSAISQAERKDSKPQKKTLEQLANVYDCKAVQLTL